MSARELIARVPGSVETWKLLKNLRHAARSRLGTRGNVRSLALGRAEAVAYVREIFAKVDRVVAENGGWDGKVVLELGPGDTLGPGVLAVAHGAARYLAIDRFAVQFDWAAERAVFDDLVAALAPQAAAHVRDRITPGIAGYEADPEVFAYRNDVPIEDAPRLLGESRFDVVYSNAVLEHVADVRASLRAIASLLAPGGVMLHDVDLRSHQRFERHGLHFLEYPPALWRLMTSHTGEPNRVRLPAYRDILNELGFGDVSIQVTERFDPGLVRRVRPRLAPEFRNLEPGDLEVATFRLRARAPRKR